jgi:HK97 family phage major capsid protein
MPSQVAQDLRDRRLKVWEEAKAVSARATEENRALTAEEQGTWDALAGDGGELDKLDERIGAVLKAEKRSADTDAAYNALDGRPRSGPASILGGSQGSGYGQGRESRSPGDQGGDASAELRAWLAGTPGTPKHFELRHDTATRGPLNLRTLSTIGNPSGGYLTPTDFYDQLIAHLVEVSGVLQAGPTILNTAGGEVLQIPKTTQHSTVASAAQAGVIGQSDPQFGLAQLQAYKYGVLLQVARELLDDSGVDLVGYLAMQAGRAIGNKFGSDLVTGTGTGQPTGFLPVATVGVTSTNTGHSGSLAYSDLVNLEYSVIAPYRQSRSCYWIAADKTIGSLRLITDTQGRPIWEPSMVLGSPDLLLGKPLVADPFMPALATGATPIAFGDFSQFFVRLVGPVRFERSDDFLFNDDLVAFRCVLRGDGTLVDLTGAIKKCQAAAT